ncbi:MacS family sensor histidine kinase [Glycomyces rhizosphaerae]|uniref:MacS family sensor histidine kinase n=1 Tax=Glycomyces rhizosphaerae TaxID=2054422 RepID=A0ABV7Q1F4_9ACTN
MGLQTQLRRAIAVYRFVALGYPVLLGALAFDALQRPVAAAALVALLIGWTAAVSYRYTRNGYEPKVVYTDLAVTAAAVALSAWALAVSDRAWPISLGPWLAGIVLVWGAAWGRRSGAVAGGVIAVFGMVFRGGINENTVNEAALLVLTGFTMGHLVRLGVEAEERTRRATERDAAARERERLARDIHDSVLQVLALVQRRGNEIGGEAAELGRLAGRQEEALRALISSEAYRHPLDGRRDLRELIGRHAGESVTVAAPATPVRLPTATAQEVAAAVASAVDNVREHCPDGTRVWLLVEDDGEAVTVSVRDDGPGIAPGRLAAAAAEGRLGVAQSIEGRVRELGGTVQVVSGPGQGTEIEMRVPRPREGDADGDAHRGR